MSPLHHPDSSAEHRRLVDSEARRADWKNWGPYLAERAWGTVREDYSSKGDAWRYFPHEHARSRAYRWNEDGLAGTCNRHQNACLALALWNERDPILKERLFGLTGPQGNHGEDVKEYYFYLDNVPSHAWMRMLYKYPQVEFPYRELVEGNAKRGTSDPELELADLLDDVFAEGRYFDVFVDHAKAGEDDLLCRITAHNRGPEPAPLHVLPHLWFRNTWSWGHDDRKPRLHARDDGSVEAHERHLGTRYWWSRCSTGESARHLFTENETNHARLHDAGNRSPHVKDAFHERVIDGREEAVNPDEVGTKCAAWFSATVPAGESLTVEWRFADVDHADPFADFDAIVETRRSEADEFHALLAPAGASDEERRVQRQALAGLLWTKQFYHYSVEHWIAGDPASPPPPSARLNGRNRHWRHVHCYDVISMPDKWEYPWFAAWDLAFHVVPLARIDPEWAKRQLVIFLREWYQHPNGQIPAYEWALDDVNPPVHAWACWQVYQVSREITGEADTDFLERVFHKLLLNFTWWVNRKDRDGNDIFSGGFLGLDNIAVFDRSHPPPTGGHVEQADSTGWMAMFSLNMMRIALELAQTRPPYEDVATKFFEHFLAITRAIRSMGIEKHGLWDERAGFFHDVIHLPDGRHVPLEVRSMVGLVPLFATEVLEPELLDAVPRFRRRMQWVIDNRPHWVEPVPGLLKEGSDGRRLLSLVTRPMLERILERLLDTKQFLSPHGLRGLSREHADKPFALQVDGRSHDVRYEPGESQTKMFGGNSNWRGPVWFPLNFLAIEALEAHHRYHGDDLAVELPRGSGRRVPLDEVAGDLSRRLASLFLPDPSRGGRRPCVASSELQADDPHWKDHVPFHEFFDGDDGTGLGASHQTGWTALVAELIHRHGGR
ncbi:MAG: glucosidase [Acidobacteriota bacterium]